MKLLNKKWENLVIYLDYFSYYVSRKFKIEENDDIIVDEATLLFGDIVEID